MKQSNFEVFGNFLKWFAICALVASVFLLKLANNRDTNRHLKEMKKLYDTLYAARLETQVALEQQLATQEKCRANLDKAVQKGQECQAMVINLMNEVDKYKGQVKKTMKTKIQDARDDFFKPMYPDTGRFEIETFPKLKPADPDTPVKKWSRVPNEVIGYPPGSSSTGTRNIGVGYATLKETTPEYEVKYTVKLIFAEPRQSNPKPHRWGLGISGGAGIGERWRIRPQLTLGLQYNFLIF